jgi:hypothetical protein
MTLSPEIKCGKNPVQIFRSKHLGIRVDEYLVGDSICWVSQFFLTSSFLRRNPLTLVRNLYYRLPNACLGQLKW